MVGTARCAVRAHHSGAPKRPWIPSILHGLASPGRRSAASLPHFPHLFVKGIIPISFFRLSHRPCVKEHPVAADFYVRLLDTDINTTTTYQARCTAVELWPNWKGCWVNLDDAIWHGAYAKPKKGWKTVVIASRKSHY